MKKETRLAIQALRKARYKIAFDANLHRLGIATPYTRKCAAEYAALSAAIQALEKPGMRAELLPGLEAGEIDARERGAR